MSQDLQDQIDALRRDVDALKAVIAGKQDSKSQEGSFADRFGNELKNNLMQELAEKNKAAGIAAGFVIAHTNADGQGSSSVRYSLVTKLEAADLPSDEQITTMIKRLTPLVTSPLALRALRELARPRFERGAMRKTGMELAAALGVAEALVEQALRPLVGDGTLRQVKTGEAEFYEWDGSNLAMVLLIHG